MEVFDFRNSPQLRPFILRHIHPTGKRIGDGSYGTVEELDMGGLICAGKKLHAILVERGNMSDGTESILRRFVEECSLLSVLRHPNVVQFLGICFLETGGLPVLVMEFLPRCLDSLLDPGEDTERLDIPLGMKYDILSDTAQGLAHLHTQTPPIIHRDVTAKNILLTSAMIGKIADLGVARLLNLQPGRLAVTMTKAPGTLAYMPPEVLEENPEYNASIDVFSLGHLILYTIVQDFPYPTAPTRPDPHNPGMIVGVMEVQRRSRQMQELSRTVGGEEHPLVQLVARCLHNDPRQRPSARQVLSQLREMRTQIDDPYKNMSKLELIQALRRRKGGGMEAALQAQVTQLQGQLQVQGVALEASRAETQQVQHQLQTREAELEARLAETQAGSQRLQTNLEQVQGQLQVKKAEVQQFQSRMQHVEARQPPRSFKWRRGKNLLFATGSAHAVVLNGKVYVGGGYADRHDDEYTIQVYTPETDGWNRLPKCQAKYFALAVMNHQLVLVGGYGAGGRRANVVVWDSTAQGWTKPYPDFPIMRQSPAAVGYQQYLVIAGGYNGSYLTNVNVLDSTTKRWSTATPLPVGCSELTAAVVGDMLYLLGGLDGFLSHNKHMLNISLPALVTHGTTSTPSSPTTTWQVTETKFTRSTAVSLYSSLLAMGGVDASYSSNVRLYNTQTRQWSKIANVPAAVQQCSCSVLNSGEIMLIGGRDSIGRSDKLYIVSVN